MLSHEMPVPFGFSIGDCIAVCLLVKDTIRALDDVNGSKAECQSVIRELGALDRALLQVVALQEVFGEGDGRTRELIALFGTVNRSVEGCKSCVGGFLEKIKGYEGALGSGEDGNANGDTHGNSLGSTSKSNPRRRSTVGRKLKGVKGKVSWALGKAEELNIFRAEMNAHCSAINMLLLTASV
jgi:hypothetical protein